MNLTADPREHDPLGFIAEVIQAFGFLEREYGFRRITETSELVRYERGPIFVEVIREVGVNVSIGRNSRLRDGARGVWRQLRHEWGVKFPVEYLAAAMGSEDELDPARGVVSNRAEVREHVNRLAEFVRRHARGLLSGDVRVYRAVAAVGRRRSRELTDWASGKPE